MEEKKIVEQAVKAEERELTEPEMEKVVGGVSVPMRSADDGISAWETREGALAEMGDIYNRIRELSSR